MVTEIAVGVLLIIFIFDIYIIYRAQNEGKNIFYRTISWLNESQTLNPEGRPYLPSIVLVHGYVGSPKDFIYLAEELAGLGYRVVCPVTPGQTTRTPILSRGEYTLEYYEAWLTAIIKKEKKLTGRKPLLVGHSMGGTLATLVAPKDIVEKLVLLAPFFSLPYGNEIVIYAAKILRWLLPVIPKFSKGVINDPKGSAEYQPGSMYLSLKAFLQLEKIALTAKKQAVNITIPTLVVISQNDHVASAKKTTETFGDMNNVQIENYPNSNHILLYDCDKNEIIKKIINFIAQHTSTNPA
jgi:carboxylesterase